MSRQARSRVVDLEVIVVARTAMAVKVRPDEASEGVWLPISQVEIDGPVLGPAVVTLPEWLAVERGLI